MLSPSPASLRAVEGDDEQFFFRLQVEGALSACVKLAPEWLQRAIRRAESAQTIIGSQSPED